MIARVIIIGDVHGCYDETCDLLEKVSYDATKDRLIFVGDLIDRGPKSLETIRLLRELNAECTIGNHDERLVRYRKHLKHRDEDPDFTIPMKPPINPVFGELTEEDWKWLESLPMYIRISPTWVVIHAGLEPGIPIEKQDVGALLHGRYLRKSTGKIERSLFHLTPGDSCVWPEMWDGRENIVYGHMVTPTRMPHIDISASGAICVGIDTGCCFGHNLTAMVMEPEGYSFSFVSVPARNTYDPDLLNYTVATRIP